MNSGKFINLKTHSDFLRFFTAYAVLDMISGNVNGNRDINFSKLCSAGIGIQIGWDKVLKEREP